MADYLPPGRLVPGSTERDPNSNIPYLTKGVRVRFRYFKAQLVSLAGVQPKFGATEVVAEGVIEHLYGDHPTAPTKVQVHARDDQGEVHKFNVQSIFAVVRED